MQDRVEHDLAKQVAPHLFQEEVDPVKFLRVSDFDPWAAARTMTAYWKYRKLVFEDQWLLPMAQSYGALPVRDLEFLRVGYTICYDEYVFLDFSRLTEYVGTTSYTDQELEKARNRVMLYLLTVTASEHAQRIGKKFVVVAEGITRI